MLPSIARCAAVQRVFHVAVVQLECILLKRKNGDFPESIARTNSPNGKQYYVILAFPSAQVFAVCSLYAVHELF